MILLLCIHSPPIVLEQMELVDSYGNWTLLGIMTKVMV